MRSRLILLSLTLLAAAPGVYAHAQLESYAGASSTFSIANKTGVPGKTLSPGNYSIKVVDQLSDRMIVKVENQTTKDHVVFLGIPPTAPSEAAAAGPVDWKSGPGGAPALRGFVFSPSLAVEFVYPKNEAVAIATQNTAQVIAVDPISEGLPPLKNMSKDDMRMVDLWALSLGAVGPDDKAPAIQAKRYVGEPLATSAAKGTSPLSSQPQQVASLEQPQLGINTPPPAAKRRPVISKLPHTASPMLLIALFGALCLIASGVLRLGSIVATRIPNQG